MNQQKKNVDWQKINDPKVEHSNIGLFYFIGAFIGLASGVYWIRTKPHDLFVIWEFLDIITLLVAWVIPFVVFNKKVSQTLAIGMPTFLILSAAIKLLMRFAFH